MSRQLLALPNFNPQMALSLGDEVAVTRPKPVTNTRRNDAASSRAAGEGVERSGIASDQRQAVLTLIRRHPGSTSKQLAAFAAAEGIKLDRFQVARRCPELIERGHVTDPKTDARNNPHQELRWWPVAG